VLLVVSCCDLRTLLMVQRKVATVSR